MHRILVIGGCVSIILLAGCESADVNGNFWQQQEQGEQAQASAPTPETSKQGSSDASTSTASSSSSASTNSGDSGDSADDQASYSSFSFTYGGFNGSGARSSGVRIANLRLSSNSLSFTYRRDLSAWGLSNNDHTGALACFFVQNSGGKWIGGKFDWISSSRKSRDLNHVTKDKYGGWTLSGVPNPTRAAFVIVSPDGKRRSNVLAGTWSR